MKNLKELAKPYYAGASHRWEHVERVYSLAMSIGAKEGADLSILEAAARFHDCKKRAQHEGAVKCHAEAGAEEIRKVLVDLYPNDKLNKIYKKKLMLKPETFNTETARKLAEVRYPQTATFMYHLAQIWNK